MAEPTELLNFYFYGTIFIIVERMNNLKFNPNVTQTKKQQQNPRKQKLTSNTWSAMWRFLTKRLFLLSGICMRDIRKFFSPWLSEHSLNNLPTSTRYCGLVENFSGRLKETKREIQSYCSQFIHDCKILLCVYGVWCVPNK